MNLLRAKNERSKKIYKNIILSVFVKGGSVVVGLLIVPITINYIDPLQYGIWLTISSVVSWMSFFDVGMANGLRNRLSQALAMGEIEESRAYISTTYLALTCIAIMLFVVYLLLSPYIDWRLFLNIPPSVGDNIQLLMFLVVGAFCFQLVVQIINAVLTAYHEPAMAGFIIFLGQLLSLLVIFALTRTISGTLTLLTVTMLVVPIMVLLSASFILYRTKLLRIAPKFIKANLSYAKDIMSLGGTFFFIQIGALILLYTNNIIISKVIGPQSVTEFNVAYRLYGVVTMLFLIIVNPYWSAFTDAYAKGDFTWMRENLRKLRIVWVLLSVIVIPIVYFSSDFLFQAWLGSSVYISKPLSFTMALYAIGHSILTLNSYLLNGLGKLKIQLILYCLACTINIPLSIMLARIYGTSGVAASSVILFFFIGIIMWIQNSRIVEQRAEGIWNQ